jgi:hypothetical protein
MKTMLGLIALGALIAGCASDANESMRKDTHGYYASTAHYNSMERDEFVAAMRAGMRDFDAKLASLQTQAAKLGPDAMEEYHGDLDELMEQRREFEAELEKHNAMLSEEWRDHREDVAERYLELRHSLDETYDEVVEEA